MPEKDKMLFAGELHNALSESMLEIQNAGQILGSIISLLYFLS